MERLPRYAATALLPVVLALIALMPAAAGCGSGQVPLAYTYEEGDSHTFEVTLALDGAVSGAGIAADDSAALQDLQVSVRESYEVLDVTDGVATIAFRVEPPVVTQGGEAVPTPGAATQAITLKVDAAGKIVGIEGLDQALPPGLSGSSLPFDLSQFGPQTTLVYPEGGLAKPGDTWVSESKVPVPGTAGQEIVATTTGTLVAVTEEDGRSLADIEFTVDVPIDITIDLAALVKELGLGAMLPADADPEDLAFSMTMQAIERLEGTARVDTETGVPETLEADLSVSLTMEIIQAPEGIVPPEQMGPVTMDMSGTIFVDRVE